MKQTPIRNRPYQRRGAAGALVAVSLTLLLSMVALTIDIGRLYIVRAELMNTVDAAALAGASALAETSRTVEERGEEAVQRATQVAQDNLGVNSSLSIDTFVEVGRWVTATATFVPLDGDDLIMANAVRTTITVHDVSYLFAGILGKDKFSVTRESTAAIGQTGCRLWARKNAKIAPNAETDSYDSTEGEYDVLAAGSAGNVCSCQGIEVQGQYVINGSALYGSEGKDGGFTGDPSNVTGRVGLLPNCADTIVEFGGVFVDNDLIGLTAKGKDPFDDLKGQKQYSCEGFHDHDNDDIMPAIVEDFYGFDDTKGKLKLNNDSLTLPAGTYYFERIVIRAGGMLYTTPPTTLYIGNTIDVHNGGIVNPSRDPLGLTIIHAGKKMHLKNASDFYGYVIAPDAKVKVVKGGDFFGAVIAKYVEFKEESNFHADEALPVVEVFDPPVLVK